MLMLVLFAGPSSAQQPARWYSVRPRPASSASAQTEAISAAVETKLFNYIRGRVPGVEFISLTVDDLYETLRKASLGTPEERAQPFIIVGDVASTRELVIKDRPPNEVLTRLGLRVLNPRVAGVPFYVLTKQGTATSSTARRKVAYIARAHPLAPGHVEALLEPHLGPITVVQLGSSADLATRLRLDDKDPARVDFIAIYDDDPSPDLLEIVRAYDDRGAPLTVMAFRLLKSDLLHGIGSSVSYAIVNHERVTLYDQNEFVAPGAGYGILTVAQKDRDSFPVVLANFASLPGLSLDQFTRVLADVSLQALFEHRSGRGRCGEGLAALYHAYLINAYLMDRASLLKALGLWGHSTLMQSTARDSQYGARTKWLETFLSDRFNVNVTKPENFVERIEQEMVKPPLRERYARSAPDFYRLGLDGVQTAGAAKDPAAARRLASGRLLEAVRLSGQSNCNLGGGTGTQSSAADYDPYFALLVLQSQYRTGQAR